MIETQIVGTCGSSRPFRTGALKVNVSPRAFAQPFDEHDLGARFFTPGIVQQKCSSVRRATLQLHVIAKSLENASDEARNSILERECQAAAEAKIQHFGRFRFNAVGATECYKHITQTLRNNL